MCHTLSQAVASEAQQQHIEFFCNHSPGLAEDELSSALQCRPAVVCLDLILSVTQIVAVAVAGTRSVAFTDVCGD